MPNAMLICEGNAGIIISTSGAAATFFAREDLPGHSLADILPEGAFAARLRELGELVVDEPRAAAWTFVVSGRSVPTQVTLVKTGTRCVIGIAQSEPELVKTSARLAYLLRATAAITYSCSGPDASGRARVTFMSENVSQVLGYEAQEFLDDPELRSRAIHPDDRRHVVAAIAQIMQGEHPLLRYRFRHKDGSWRWMRDEPRAVMGSDGRLEEIIGSWVDITRQRDVEEALRRSEASFRTVIDHLPQGIFVRSGTEIVYANAACAALLGVASPAEVIGQTPLDFSPPYNRDAVRERMSAANTTGRSAVHESEWRRADGTTVPVEVEALAIEYRGVPSMLVIARDLTERRAMVTRMAAADRMLAHATLAAGVAHEINGPLAFVLTNLSILASEVPILLSREELAPGRRSRADIEHLLRDAQEGAMRVRDVVRDLRLLSGPAEELGARCDVGAVLSSCAKMAWADIEGRARLVMNIQDVTPVRGSASRLSQVFSNLIANAAQAIAAGRPHDNEIRLSARRQDADHVLVEISDTGVGMAPELVARIFEPFFTTKPVGIGSGLGLAICQSVVASLGGTINVASEPGRGTRWSVVLPVAGDQPTPAAPQEDRDRGRRGRILVVDDDPLFARSLQLLLDDHDVLTYTSAVSALERIRTNESFDLVLCDLNMPDLDGMSFHSGVRNIDPTLAERVIFVTGGAMTPESAAFLAKNGSLTLEKPFDPSALTALVTRAVAARESPPASRP